MTTESRFTGFIERARELGADDAKVIRADSIITAPWVRLKCQFGCGGWGSSLCCPPRTPTPEETARVIACYERALLVHSWGKTRPSPLSWLTLIKMQTKIVAPLERDFFLAGFYKALAFGAGPCLLCHECNAEACRHPDKARPSMEACGIDVFATVRANGFSIEVLSGEGDSQDYYGLVLIE